MDEAEKQGAGLRLRLRLDGSLINLPWEFLYDTTYRRFLSHSNRTPIVRFLDLPQNISALPVTPPLKALVMIASPNDYAPLDVEQEWQKVKQAVKGLEERGLLQLTRLEIGTLSALRRQLLLDQFHIFHYIGHGAYDDEHGEGVLLLEDENGRGRRISGSHLGTLLHDHRSLRLVLLNACDGARTAVTDLFAGVAQHLVLQGLPAVIAMQFEITDHAAITLSQAFYEALVTGISVDAALAEARKAIFAEGNDVEWGTPVLYMRATDGRLFDLVPSVKTDKETGRQGAGENWGKGFDAISAEGVENRHVIQNPESKTKNRQPWFLYAIGFVVLLIVGWLGILYLRDGNVPTATPTTASVAMIAANTPVAPVDTATPTFAPASATLAPTQVASVVVATETATIPTATPTIPTATATKELTATYTATPVPPTATHTATPLPPTATLLSGMPHNPAAGVLWTEPTSKIDFVFVPAGEFLMGSSDDDKNAGSDEKPQHSVTTNAYWIGKTEVTNAQFRQFIKGGGYTTQSYWTDAGWKWRTDNKISQPSCLDNKDFNGDIQPVVCVSWYEALSYTKWLSEKSGLIVRLPSEAEWEKAARGTDGLIYPWGNEFEGTRANYCDENCTKDLKDKAVNDGFVNTAPVGSFPSGASPYGALDMAGNVWEWTSREYLAYPYVAEDGREDETTADARRVLRGGSCNNISNYLRTCWPGHFSPGS